MGREKRHTVVTQRKGVHARERHKRFQRARTLDTPLIALNARPEPPNMKSKHHSYYEIVENKDKKKKLEFQITNQKTPPPGFEFIPIGNPELTLACKELSREQDAMIFIVSNSSPANPLAQQVNRIGHHIRQGIVEEARREVSDAGDSSDDQARPGAPEPIPETQEEIDEQADSAIRDLFPRIPNTDRQTIIEHSFKLGAHKRGEPLVGLAPDIPLSRRVQLAVLAHIRHTHTRYDSLLKETTYSNARKAVEQLCLDVLVKWRGDEENGRDQLDEILREVVVISDSEDDDEDTEAVDADSSGVDPGDPAAMPGYLSHYATRSSGRSLATPAVDVQYTSYLPAGARAQSPYDKYALDPDRTSRPYLQEGYAVHRARRGFKRYQAALSTRWDEAVDRVRHERGYHPDEPPPPPLARNLIYTSHERQQGQWLSSHNSYASSAHGPAYHVDARGDPHPLDIPSQRPIRAAPTASRQRSLSDDLSKGASSHTGPQQRTMERILMRPKEARDFLVPSIEPLSPSSGARPVAPVFIRTVSPNRVLDPTRRLIGDAWDQTRAHDSPRWTGEHGSLKRRRPVDVEPYDPRQPAQSVSQRHNISSTWQQPLARYAVTQSFGESFHLASTLNSRAQIAHASAGSATTYPVSNSRSDMFRTGPPVGLEQAPVVLRNWNEELSSGTETLTAHDFRRNTSTDGRVSSSSIVRARQAGHYHEPENETYFHGLSINDDVVSGPYFRQSLTLRQASVPLDAVPIQTRTSRGSPSYLPRVRDSNPSKSKPTNCSATYYPAVSSFTRYHEDSEPAIVFVRHVDRQRQPRMIEDRDQQYQDDNPDRFRANQRPPTFDSSCALPQAMPPYDESYGISADYSTPHYGPPPHRAGSPVFQDYPNQHDYRRDQADL